MTDKYCVYCGKPLSEDEITDGNIVHKNPNVCIINLKMELDSKSKSSNERSSAFDDNIPWPADDRP